MTDTPRPSPEDAATDREDGMLRKPDAAAKEAIERATAANGNIIYIIIILLRGVCITTGGLYRNIVSRALSDSII